MNTTTVPEWAPLAMVHVDDNNRTANLPLLDVPWDTDADQETFYRVYASIYGVDDAPMQWAIFGDQYEMAEGVENTQYLTGH